jgi:hypothetical protein
MLFHPPLGSPNSRRLRRLAVEALEDRRTPAAMLTIDNTTLVEGNDGVQTALVTVRLTEPHGNAVSVNYTTADGTAHAGTDYLAASGQLSFARNEIAKTIAVRIPGDRAVEPDEGFTVRLSNPKGAKISRGEGYVTVLDDEPRVNIYGGYRSEGNDGSAPMTFNLSLSAPYDRPVTVHYTTADQSATAGSDYATTSGSWTFQPGADTTHSITVMVTGDRVPEPTESFAVRIDTADSYAQVQTSSAAGTIYDDEPRITVSDAYSDGGNTVTFTVSLSNAYDQPVTVHFMTANGTAAAGTDYEFAEGTLTFDNLTGQTTATVTVQLLDSTPGMGKYFSLVLSDASANAAIDIGTATGYVDYYPYYDPGYGWYY